MKNVTNQPTIKPLNGYVILKFIEDVPNSDLSLGEVLATHDNECMLLCSSRVLFRRGQGDEFDLDQEPVIIISESKLLCLVKDK